MILNETIKSFDIRSNKIIFLVVCISVSASIIDTTLIRVYDFITMEATSEWRVTAFIIISVTCSVPQIIILNYIKAKVKEIGKDRLHFQTIHKMVTIGQYTLIVILGILISQILLRQYYDVGILIGAITLSYTLAVLMMSVLSGTILYMVRVKSKFCNSAVRYSLGGFCNKRRANGYFCKLYSVR